MPRRRRKLHLTEKQRAELRRLSKNRAQKYYYAEHQKRKFFEEYMRICRKYGCYVGGWTYVLTGCRLRKVKQEKSFLKNHFEDIKP